MSRTPHRFHHPSPISAALGETIDLPSEESHHLLRVMRLRSGAEVIVFDSTGRAWNATVAEPDAESPKDIARVTLTSEIAPQNPEAHAAPRLHVAVSLLKPRAMDWMIEKLCELDVESLHPLLCDRTVVRPKGDEANTPPERWDRIALAAAKQSGRNVPMAFHSITPLREWLTHEKPRMLTCFAHAAPDAVGLGEWLSARAGMGLSVQVAIGPEGGWTPAEVELFRASGYQAVNLGPFILRAETAALTVAAACRVML